MEMEKLSYVKSLRFKLMLLVVIPLVGVAIAYIIISMISTNAFVRELCADNGIDMPSLSGVIRMCIFVFIGSIIVVFPPMTMNITKIIQPLRELVKVTQILADGSSDVEIKVTRTDEYGQLQSSYIKLIGQIQKQSDAIEKIADGDLTVNYVPTTNVDVVGKSLVKLLDSNNTVFNSILESSRQVNSAASQVSDQSQALAQGSTEQNTMVAEINVNVEEMTEMTENSTKLANDAVKMTVETNALVSKSTTNMNELEKAMTDILHSSAEISKVIKVIDDIAFQTNILALNAAVEAARAGSAGKGFAVVDDEVRNLASKSAAAASETSVIIEGTIQKVKSGSVVLEHTSSSLKSVADNSEKVNEIIMSISDVSAEQHESIMKISQSISQISETVAVNSAMAEESAASSEELSAQANAMQSTVQRFKLK